ncbi:hypothetical protein [Paractinoplanes hotanensis]|uniref:Uncharacterized protein n=1 Tax=Paractinoplanes hotanensis TaxID=2906497 RepID=A0ABT0Y2J0_9ACTN|nr:hypothetical protein [Actinoplanes hotanensis]MCM4080070.1 hypothetical protein [Actinoplanes hotanensis]
MQPLHDQGAIRGCDNDGLWIAALTERAGTLLTIAGLISPQPVGRRQLLLCLSRIHRRPPTYPGGGHR